MRPSSLSRALVPALALAVAACAVSAPQEGGTGSTEERSLGAVNTRWPSPVIPVCWNTAGTDTPYVASEKGKVQAQVVSEFGRAGVTFTGWGTCTGSETDAIVIWIADQNPSSDIGRNKPTKMVLNFSMQGIGSALVRARCTESQARTDACILMSAVHEFGHAVGLLHEEKRTETPSCGVFDSHVFDDFNVNIGPLDPRSIMYHCNPSVGGDPIQTTLSDGDVAGIRLLFGQAATNPAAVVPVTLAPQLLPWYFLRTSTGAAQVAPMENGAQDDAVFYVVPAVDPAQPSAVSLR